jgi:nanoRNase/pAp phosphatase (c-di-AMP/oligoRNAs hydrolase)
MAMRLITRADFDGLVCAVILKHTKVIDSIKLVHPKDVQDGLVEVTTNDVLANVPYVPGCGMWFDHHSSEEERGSLNFKFKGDARVAPSTARVLYEYYGGKDLLSQFDELVEVADKVDSAQLDIDDVLNPKGWVLLSFIMDPRTGLGRYHDYRVSNYQLMEMLIEEMRNKSEDEILSLPDVEQRVVRYFEQDAEFREMIFAHTKTDGNVIFTDLRGVEKISTGNRFLIYSLYPQQNISLWVTDGRAKLNVAIAVGKSIFNRTSNTDIGSLMLKYGGGGHKAAGTCQVPYADADRAIGEIVAQLKKDG